MSTSLAGQDAKLYLASNALSGGVNSSGDYTGTFSGAEVLGVTDVSLSGSVLSSFDTTARNDVIGTDGRGKAKFEITLNLIDRDDAAPFIDLYRKAFVRNTELAHAVMDQAIATTGAQGLIANMKVHSFVNGQPLNDKQTFDVTLRPSSYPGWLKV
jgi:hypothetical protein